MKKKKQSKQQSFKEIPLPKPKHVQVQRGLALRLMEFTETEFIDGIEVHYAYNVAEKMSSIGYNPRTFIPQMIKKGYLVIRTKAPEQESYYICKTIAEGQTLKMKLAA